MFGEELNKLLKDWQPSVLPDGKSTICLKVWRDYCNVTDDLKCSVINNFLFTFWIAVDSIQLWGHFTSIIFLSLIWMWFNFIADSKYQFVTVSGFLLRFSVGVVLKSSIVEQRADWGADALCPAEISPLSQHQILWSSNLWTALAPRVWKCLRPKQFQTAQPRRPPSVYASPPSHRSSTVRSSETYTLFISVAIILQPIFVVMPLCIVIHFCLSCLLGTVLSFVGSVPDDEPCLFFHRAIRK